MPKKFLIYGEFWDGTLPSLLEIELRRRGYNVSVFDFTRIVPGIKDRGIAGRIRRRLFSEWYDRQVNKQFVNFVGDENPDFIVVSKGVNLWPETVRALTQADAKLVNWNPDDFFNPKNTNANLLGAFEHYDLIVSSRPHLFAEYRDRGAKEVAFIDWYYVPELHFPRASDIDLGLTFVGSWSPLREQFISKISIPIEIWGGGWERASKQFRSLHEIHFGAISQIEMSSIFSRSKYNLNLITQENRDLSNLRFFEVCASGGLLITEKNESSLSYLDDGLDCLMYERAEDLNLVLSGTYDLSTIAERGRLKIAEGKNSFRDRVGQLLEFID